VATVPLDGLRIEVPHNDSPAEVAKKLEDSVHDLAQNKFSHWGVKISALEEGGGFLLRCRRESGTHFDAVVKPEADRAVVTLTGAVEIGLLKLTLAGGSEGLRRRVHEGVEETLRKHLG
jgi:hypothetical protein